MLQIFIDFAILNNNFKGFYLGAAVVVAAAAVVAAAVVGAPVVGGGLAPAGRLPKPFGTAFKSKVHAPFLWNMVRFMPLDGAEI